MSIPDLEEDYESIYKDGYRPDPYNNTVIPIGQCLRMCSLMEMQERETHQRLSKYEAIPGTFPPVVDFKTAIKEYKRSCVGMEFTSVENLRPWSVLRKTLHYLLLDICFRKDDWLFVSDFVFDRLKAVRQDMIIQRIEGRRYIEVLEGSVRFLVYSLYRLTCTYKDYTKDKSTQPKISLEGPVSGLTNHELNIIREMKLTTKCLRDCLRSLIVQYQENVPDSPYRPLFEAVNLIINLPFIPGQVFATTEYQSKTSFRNSDEMFKTVFKMYREHLAGNHWTALKYLPDLVDFPVLILAYAPAIAQLQVHLVQLLKKLYGVPTSNTASLAHLCALICPKFLERDEDERIAFGRFLAIQFGIYDENRNLCDFKTIRQSERPNNFFEAAALAERRRQQAKEDDESTNETRAYALQLIAGKNWFFYKEVISVYGVQDILDPTQPVES